MLVRRVHVLLQFPGKNFQLGLCSAGFIGRDAPCAVGMLRCSVSVLTQNEEVCSADASVFCPAMCSHLENRNHSYEVHVNNNTPPV